MALINKLTAIGDAIRSKTGETAELTLDEMATAITNLSIGSEPNLGSFYTSENGTFSAADDGYDGYSDITVEVPTESATLTSLDVTANGEYHAIDEGVDGFDSVYVNVPSGSLQTATITASGNRIYVDNYVAPGDNFILFYTAYSGSGNVYTRSMFMPNWDLYVYNMTSNTVTDSTYKYEGLKALSTNLIDTQSSCTSLSQKTSSTITFDGRSLFYSSDTSCDVGNSAILVYVG